MTIEHSPLMNAFISIWFETSVDSMLRFETMLDFFRGEWHTSNVIDDNIVLSGRLNSAVSEEEMVEEIKPLLEAAIRSGKI